MGFDFLEMPRNAGINSVREQDNGGRFVDVDLFSHRGFLRISR